MDKITKKRTAGYDEVPPFILKNAAVYLAEPLIHIVNTSFKTGVFPDALKMSIICPLYKKGDKTNVSNYRPLALQSVFSKFLENAYSARLVAFLESNGLLSDSQHGFRKARSTTTAITQFVNQLMTDIQNNTKAYGFFYDFSKAFDMVNHTLLLSKLRSLGIRGVANKWVETFLKNRKQMVKITHSNGVIYSNEEVINVGVPQGASIAPILFIIYTNDLDKTVTTGSLTTFADDTTQLVCDHFSVIEDKCKLAVNQIADWSLQNELILNTEKTVIINFNDRYVQNNKAADVTSPLLYVNGKSIRVVDVTKFLGLTIDSRLKWITHINNVAQKISSGCYLIKRVLRICNFNTAKLVYFSYVHSNLLYGIALWGHSPHAIKLFRLQKRAMKYLANASYEPTDPNVYFKDSTKPLYKKFDIMPLPCMYIFTMILYVINNKHLTKVANEKLCDYTLRKNNNFYDLTTVNYSKGPLAQGVNIFNHLPYEIKCKVHENDFSKRLKNFLLYNCFYSLNEFLNNDFNT